MSGEVNNVRDLYLRDTTLGLITNNFRNLFKDDDDPCSKNILTARWIESLVLTTLAVGTSAYVLRACAKALRPALLLGIPVGLGLAYSAHCIRSTVLADKKHTPIVPYKTSFAVLYHDAFSIMKRKWQILEATTVAALALGILGMTLRLSTIHPLAVGFFASLAVTAAGAYLAVDYVIGRSFRQI